jgi:hypothetical protein
LAPLLVVLTLVLVTLVSTAVLLLLLGKLLAIVL